jgi:LuxR family maltose regulon positive regulatory protein
MAQVCAAEGDLEAASGLLDEAERQYDGDFSPNVRPVPALRARTWIRQGRVDQALAWAGSRGLSVADDLSYLREFEHVTLARALVAEHAQNAEERLGRALDLLGRLLRAAQDAKRTGSVIEILVVEAMAHQRRGDTTRALTSLDGALILGEPEGYARTFLDEGGPMAALMTAVIVHGTPSPYHRRLRAELGGTPVTPGPTDRAMVEPLSSRERDVLRLLSTELNGPEIARELVVSLNTVRTHTKNLYTKLGVNDRRAAVRRAHDLDLL